MTKTVDIGTALQNYVAIPKNEAELLGVLVNDLEIAQHFKVIRNLRTAKLLPKYTPGKGWRPVDTAVTSAMNKGSWGSRKIQPHTGMKILSLNPEDYRDSFASEMLDPNATEGPFAGFVWKEEFKKLIAEVNDNAYLSKDLTDTDDFDAAATYDAGDYVVFGSNRLIYECLATTSAGQSPTTHPAKWQDVTALAVCDGIGTIIAAEITATNLTAVATGALSTSNALDKVEDMVKSMTAAMRKAGGTIFMSWGTYDKYLTHEKSVFPYVANPALGNEQKYVYGSMNKWKIQPATWMGTSGRVIATVDGNLVMGTNQLEDGNKIGKLIPTLHGYDAIIKMITGYQIADLEYLVVNNQA